jgi:chondroitin 4-sulfotransferase 11
MIRFLEIARRRLRKSIFIKKILRLLMKLYLLLPIIYKEKIYRMFSPPFSELEEDNEIIFVHIPKTAGNAIIETLYGQKAKGHNNIMQYKKADIEKYTKYYKFVFVRNPRDRIVSAFFYLKAHTKRAFDIEFANKYLKEYVTFEDFILALRDSSTRHKILNWTHFKPQYTYICDEENHIAVDFIGRYENINSDFDYLKLKLNRPSKELLSKNRSNHNPYWEYYNKEMVEIVREIYSNDINLFNYDFPYERISIK